MAAGKGTSTSGTRIEQLQAEIAGHAAAAVECTREKDALLKELAAIGARQAAANALCALAEQALGDEQALEALAARGEEGRRAAVGIAAGIADPKRKQRFLELANGE